MFFYLGLSFNVSFHENLVTALLRYLFICLASSSTAWDKNM